MCREEVRAANTLAFTQRGSATVVGPAYDRSHLEAGCEFCGACVSVCPTGALSGEDSEMGRPAGRRADYPVPTLWCWLSNAPIDKG